VQKRKGESRSYKIEGGREEERKRGRIWRLWKNSL